MVAAAIGVDRTVEADVGRTVPGDDGAGLFDRDLGAEAGDRTVDAFQRIEPVAVGFMDGQVEAGAFVVVRCAPSFFQTHDRDQNIRRTKGQYGAENGGFWFELF